jgi:phosphohistidine swiveling domain-containing protein
VWRDGEEQNGKFRAGRVMQQRHAAPDTNEVRAKAGTVIADKPCGTGHSKGIVRRIETLAEGDDVGGEKDVVVLVKPVQSNNNDVPLLFSLLLRVRGLVVPDDPMMWTGHISQIARECRVPIVRVALSDLERLVDGCQIDVDGTRGVLTLIDA